MPSTMLTFLGNPDPEQLRTALAEDVRFHSPVSDYSGRADVVHLFRAIGGVLESVEPARQLNHGSECTTFITGTVDDRTIEGVLDERIDDVGRVAEVTLMLRPLSALNSAVRAMRAALAASPLPSSV